VEVNRIRWINFCGTSFNCTDVCAESGELFRGPQQISVAREMEPLFLAVIYGCQAGLLRDTLHEVYLPRIQRGNVSFAANVLGVRGALLTALAAFFEQGRWGTFAQTEVEGQQLIAEDQLIILTQAGLYLTATRGYAALRCAIIMSVGSPCAVRLIVRCFFTLPC
jgi:hypothetical protein